MGIELKSKFIQYLNHQKNDQAFTLIELLAVIIIIGILGAIAIPNLLNQDVKAKQTEAKQNIILVNKSQNSFRAENSIFATNFNILAIGSVNDTIAAGNGTTTNYSYTMVGGNANTASVLATPIDNALRGYSGGVTRYSNASRQSVIGTVLCEMAVPGATTTFPVMTNTTQSPTCAADTTQRNLSL